MLIQEWMQKGGGALLDLVFPTFCELCGERLPPEEKGGLCLFCLSQIPRNRPPFCPTCGRQYYGTSEAPRCGACNGRLFPFDRLWYCAPYEGVLREALHKFKYEGKKRLAHSLASVLVAFVKEEIPRPRWDIVLPVPLAPSKERGRQFNQSALFAHALAKAVAIPESFGNLVRIRQTPPQVRLPKEKRFENVAEAFSVKDPSVYTEKHLLLVDDIVTTGATVSACAEALRQGGAKSVSVLTLARGAFA